MLLCPWNFLARILEHVATYHLINKIKFLSILHANRYMHFKSSWRLNFRNFFKKYRLYDSYKIYIGSLGKYLLQIGSHSPGRGNLEKNFSKTGVYIWGSIAFNILYHIRFYIYIYSLYSFQEHLKNIEFSLRRSLEGCSLWDCKLLGKAKWLGKRVGKQGLHMNVNRLGDLQKLFLETLKALENNQRSIL